MNEWEHQTINCDINDALNHMNEVLSQCNPDLDVSKLEKEKSLIMLLIL